LDIDRGAQPLVTRIGRPADLAIAANHRHALRRSGAEECELELRLFLVAVAGVGDPGRVDAFGVET
jgi:hypothetical protein